jgi:hypothetical protein
MDVWPQEVAPEDPLHEAVSDCGEARQVALLLGHYLRASGRLQSFTRNAKLQAGFEVVHSWLAVIVRAYPLEQILEWVEAAQREACADALTRDDVPWLRFNTPVRRAVRGQLQLRRRIGARGASRMLRTSRPRERRAVQRARGRGPPSREPDPDPSPTREWMLDLDARCRPTEPKQAQPPLARAVPRWCTRRRPSRRRRSVPR